MATVEAVATTGTQTPTISSRYAGDMSYELERYLNIRSAYGASFGPDGERLSFLLDTTGTSQVWTIADPQEWPQQRTFYDERVTFASWSPERPELIFGMDDGGNERAQLYRLDAETGEIENVTAMPDAKHRWGGWSHDGEQFAFASNRRDEAVFDIYVQDRDATGDAAKLVYEGDGWLSLAGWSPDDSRLLVSQAYSNFDQDLYVLDLETEEIEHLTPHEGDVRYSSASWAPDGDGLYLVTDEGDADTLYLAYMDLEGGELETVTRGEGWNVDGIALDDETGRFVYSRNVEGYTELTVGEFDADEPTEFERFPEPDLPGGVSGGISFDPAADRFALSTTGDTVNTNVFVVDVESGEAKRWTRAPTAGIPPETFDESDLVHVESFDELEVPGFLTLPDGYEAGNTPVVVDIHGGPESQRRPSFSSVKQYFLDRGYAYFEPNVRGSAGYGADYAALDDVEKRMDSVADIEACVEWLQDHPAIDPDRIAAKGGSYGGFMVLAALTEYPHLWAAGIDVVGIANFVTFLENTGDWRRELREAEYGSLEADREFLEDISPINNVERIEAPLFVLHGENDPRVPVGEAEQIADQAAKQGVPVRKLIFEDEGHGFSKLENRIEAYTEIADFLDEHV
ncbi:Dipeptidyl aminopeptidase/acylaminoacyl peptidase [Natronobacterium gregoryi]|uniref:Dipeptidyl aminopeptidase/acylaminoacyl peptidase n=3 Tax=Natronobacterium gregoryi TaxID=44930 RepID=L0ALJ2_NATGS|nr:dipeptidyl aminopeptidase/acylaminoacyl peptidase [Natronobacterium gregoryi SP2]ELY73566.1 peptidase S9 prolyl oligopeptidase active site domain protein [Natronobacterium gregoryi SP2]PLK19406.1 S9 family peptidase [Natronobacterium gregoryi SP2]SFJ49638.1 Dipeptidyl aminopeptidase/acylaminoacyl peptidase [Natronobacterium gregoryi]